MKTVTIDFDVYVKELEAAYTNGLGDAYPLISEAEKLIAKMIHADARDEAYRWLREVGIKRECNRPGFNPQNKD